VRAPWVIFLAVLRRPRPIVSGALLTCALLTSLLATAPGVFASTTNELRGEWQFELKCECTFPVIDSSQLQGTALISTMNLSTGEFTGTTDFYGDGGEFVENLTTKEKPHVSGNEVDYVLVNQGPSGEFFFVVYGGTVAKGGDEMYGAGVYNVGTPYEEKGSFFAKKTRSWAEVEKEKEERRIKAEKEKFEREGREKGEREGREKGELEGRAKGELEGKEKAEQELKLKAAQEATERAAKEAQAKTEREAKEKTEKEAAEKAETQAREKVEKEAREKVEKEAKQKAEKEAKDRARTATGQPAVLVGKSFTVTAAGQLSLELTNANGYAVTGALTLAPPTAVKSAAASGGTSGSAPGGAPSKSNGTTGKAKPAPKPAPYAEASYTIASHGSKTVTLKLPKGALAELEHHKTLQLVATLTTHAAGRPASTKTYDITLKPAPAKHG